MQYKITIEELTEYPENQRVYESNDGKRYFSSYDLVKGTYKTLDEPTGKMLLRERGVYVQDFQATDLTNIIKAVNNIN